MIYQIYREQQLHCSIDEAWDFFISPNNLPIIAPSEMDFTVITKIDDNAVCEGIQIDYRLKPLFGIPIRWKSEVRDLDYKNCFVDYQIEGPYKMWHHHHKFIENEDGVLMKDFLKYEMPFGFLGRLVHQLVVRKKLDYIFNNRQNVLDEIFNKNFIKQANLSAVSI